MSKPHYIKDLKRQTFQVMMIWTGISGIIVLKSSLIGPLAQLGLISLKDEITAWLISLVFVPLVVVWVNRGKTRTWITGLSTLLLVATMASVVWTQALGYGDYSVKMRNGRILRISDSYKKDVLQVLNK